MKKIKMNDFDQDFLMDLFLDSDSVSTINRLVVAVANVVSENTENIAVFNDVINRYCKDSETTPFLSINRKKNIEKHNSIEKHFYENVILNYTNHEYEEIFKMKKSTVLALINYIKSTANFNSSVIPLDKKVHIFLWILISDNSYNEVSVLFGMHKSSVCYIMNEMCSILQEHYYDFIIWPSVERQHVTSVKVNNKLKFPNCVGFIDACRLKIGSKRTKSEPEFLLLQAVCDESLMFIDVHVGEIGKLLKEKVFKSSPLYRELKNFIAFENHILGDADYKLRKNLVTPFTCDELLTREEMKFNEIHWRTKAYIHSAFELLKMRFRKLNHIEINKPGNISTLITAACVLHNFILMHEGPNEDVKEEIILCEDGVVIDTNIVKTALEKRQFLCNYVSYMDST